MDELVQGEAGWNWGAFNVLKVSHFGVLFLTFFWFLLFIIHHHGLVCHSETLRRSRKTKPKPRPRARAREKRPRLRPRLKPSHHRMMKVVKYPKSRESRTTKPNQHCIVKLVMMWQMFKMIWCHRCHRQLIHRQLIQHCHMVQARIMIQNHHRHPAGHQLPREWTEHRRKFFEWWFRIVILLYIWSITTGDSNHSVGLFWRPRTQVYYTPLILKKLFQEHSYQSHGRMPWQMFTISRGANGDSWSICRL